MSRNTHPLFGKKSSLQPSELPVLYASYPLLNALREFLKACPSANLCEENLPRKARDLATISAEIAQRPDRMVDFSMADCLSSSFVNLLLAVHDVTDQVPSGTPHDFLLTSSNFFC